MESIMDEKEFEILWEKIRKIDRNMADLFDERVDCLLYTSIRPLLSVPRKLKQMLC